jgi:hypothetical protein
LYDEESTIHQNQLKGAAGKKAFVAEKLRAAGVHVPASV